MPQIASIPHNGTQFLLRLLKENDLSVDSIGHLTDSLDITGWNKIVCPMRPPREVALSWGRRRKDYGWDAMYERLLTLPAHFFFLEHKEDALSRLSEYLHTDLKTDWEPVNHSSEHPIEIITEDQIKRAEEIYLQVSAH